MQKIRVQYCNKPSHYKLVNVLHEIKYLCEECGLKLIKFHQASYTNPNMTVLSNLEKLGHRCGAITKIKTVKMR